MTNRMQDDEDHVLSEATQNVASAWRVLTEYVDAADTAQTADEFVTWMRQRTIHQLGQAVACAQLTSDLLEELSRAMIGILEEKGRIVKEIVITELDAPKMDN